MDMKTVAQSLVSASWRAPIPLAGSTLSKRKRSDSDGAYFPRTNSGGADDVEPEESNQWHESVKNWQLERQMLGVEPSKVGLPLKQHLLNLLSTLVNDMGHGWRSVVDCLPSTTTRITK